MKTKNGVHVIKRSGPNLVGRDWLPHLEINILEAISLDDKQSADH